jgi:hypothetical protein
LDSGLIHRRRDAWNKPLSELTNEELATLLRQRFAVEHLLAIARKRVELHIDDDTDMKLWLHLSVSSDIVGLQTGGDTLYSL